MPGTKDCFSAVRASSTGGGTRRARPAGEMLKLLLNAGFCATLRVCASEPRQPAAEDPSLPSESCLVVTDPGSGTGRAAPARAQREVAVLPVTATVVELEPRRVRVTVQVSGCRAHTRVTGVRDSQSQRQPGRASRHGGSTGPASESHARSGSSLHPPTGRYESVQLLDAASSSRGQGELASASAARLTRRRDRRQREGEDCDGHTRFARRQNCWVLRAG